MTPVTIVTIVVIALLTAVVFLLTWLAYSSCIRAYRVEVAAGMHDDEVRDEFRGKRKRRAAAIAGGVFSYAVLAVLLSLFAIGVVYRAKGDNLTFGGQTALVIKSGSMSGFYDDALALDYRTQGYDANLQFGVGDVCLFDVVSDDDELVKGEVYGYRRQNFIITHRLVSETEDGRYGFRGDNNPTTDGTPIPRDRIIYHYTGRKIPGIGAFVLYAQSYFGIWSLTGLVGVAIGSEVAHRKVVAVIKDRYEAIGGGPGEGEEGHEE